MVLDEDGSDRAFAAQKPHFRVMAYFSIACNVLACLRENLAGGWL